MRKVNTKSTRLDSGRLHSSNPHLQNIPIKRTKLGDEIRNKFLPEIRKDLYMWDAYEHKLKED